MTIRKPGRYGDRFYIKEHKLCPGCGESEVRLDARFCCWCGARFIEVVIQALNYKVTQMVIPARLAVRLAVPALSPEGGTSDAD